MNLEIWESGDSPLLEISLLYNIDISKSRPFLSSSPCHPFRLALRQVHYLHQEKREEQSISSTLSFLMKSSIVSEVVEATFSIYEDSDRRDGLSVCQITKLESLNEDGTTIRG